MAVLANPAELADRWSSQQQSEWQRLDDVYARPPQVRLEQPVEDDWYDPEHVRG